MLAMSGEKGAGGKVFIFITGLWGEIRSWEDGTTLVQKTHDASKHHVQKVRNLKKMLK